MEAKDELVGREFRHFKGGRYRLEGFAKDSETLEEMVVYRALYGEGGLWVRPAKMFFETIERDGKTMKRFELVEIDKKHGFEECQPYYENPMPDVIDMRLELTKDRAASK